MKWYLKILIGFALLLIAGFFSIDFFATRIVENEIQKLKTQVAEDYDFNYKSLNLSLIDRTIVLRQFEFYTIVDSSYDKNKYDLKLDKLYLKYATYRDIFFNRSVDIVEVLLRQPEISYGLRSFSGKESKNDEANEKRDSSKNTFFEEIKLEEFRIESGKIDFYNLEKPTNKIVFVNDLNVNVNGFVIDLVKDSIYISESNKKPLFSFKEIYKNDLKKHNLSIDEVQYSYFTKELKISNFLFENKESPEVFRKSLTYRSPWFSIKVPEIVINVDPQLIYDNGIFYLPKIEIDSAAVILKNDLKFPIKPGYKPLPGRSIKAMNLNFLIDSLLIKNSQLIYVHKGKAAEEGFLKFSNLNALALRATDIDSLIKINPFLDLKVNTKFWDEGNLNVSFRMDLSSPLDKIDVIGSLKNMSFKKAENMIRPLFGVEIDSGYIDQMAFSFMMNENIGKGKMVFDYRGLRVDFKEKDKKVKKEGDEAEYTDESFGVINFVASKAVRPNNIPGEEKYKPEGNIIVDRTKHKIVFDLLWNCIANGMMDIAIKDALYDSEKSYSKKQKKKKKKEANKNK